MSLPHPVIALVTAQAGVAAVSQLVALQGVGRHQVVRWVRRGWFQRVYRGVVRIPGAPETDEQRLWAALLRCGGHAVAGPAASCWLHGLEGFDELLVTVVVAAPHRCRGTDFPARTRHDVERDRVTVRGIPALSATRAIIEVAHRLTDKELRVLIDSARRRRLLTIETLSRRAAELSETPRSRRGARAVLRIVGSGDLEQESENEREIAAFLATTTLKLEWQVTDLVPGRRLDAVDREATLVLEIDSRLWHTLGSDRDDDGLRDLEIEDACGYTVFHLTLGMVRFKPEETRRRLDAIRARRTSLGAPR